MEGGFGGGGVRSDEVGARAPRHVLAVLAEAHAFDGPCLVVAEVVKEDNVFPMIPAGAPVSAGASSLMAEPTSI